MMNMLIPSFTKTYHTAPYSAIDPEQPALSARGKTVIITGGAVTSIGASIALSFARAGAANIALIGRTESTLLQTKAKVETSCTSTNIQVFVADVSSSESVGIVAHLIRTSLGAFDIFVHNAGYLSTATTLAGADTEDWWKSFEINIKFIHLFAKHFMPKARPDATFISLSSGVVHAPASIFPGASAYAASKLAALKLDEFLAAENPTLKVFSVHPGMVDTPMTRKNVGQSANFRWDEPGLIADFSVWLASPAAEFLRGRFLWCNWDVDELAARKEEIEANPLLLKSTIGGFPFTAGNSA